MTSRLRDPITAADFGVSAEYLECAENYARWVIASEREACAKICDSLGGDVDPRDPDEVILAANSLSHAIRSRGKSDLKAV